MRCGSCRRDIPRQESQPARDLMWRVLPNRFVCRDREACFTAYCAIPLDEL